MYQTISSSSLKAPHFQYLFAFFRDYKIGAMNFIN